MPDLFVAPDEQTEKDTTIMHKRVPAVSPQKSPTTSGVVFQPPVTNPKEKSTEITEEYKPMAPTPKAVPSTETQNTQTTSPLMQKIEKDTQAEKGGLMIPLLTSFWQNPTGIYFDTQEVDEHILLFLRRHPITNSGWIIGTILFALLPPASFYAASLLGKALIIGSLPFTGAIIVFYYLIIFTNAFLSFLNWYYNISLITEKRVIDIELNNLVGKKISATKISLVQDVNYQQAGAIRSLFDYGDVLIQTASAVDNFFVHAVPKPEVVVRVVEDIIGESDAHI